MESIALWAYEIVITWKQDGSVKDVNHRIHDDFCSIRQTHSTTLVSLEEEVRWWQEHREWDSLITKHIPIGVYTTDCLPIIICWKDLYAAVHGSWKTLHAGLVQTTVKNLCRQGEEFIDIDVFIWPSISWAVYEVGEEFYELFPHEVLVERDSKLYLDLRHYTKNILLDLWIDENKILFHKACTYTDNDQYFSWRRWETGRNFTGVRKKRQSDETTKR